MPKDERLSSSDNFFFLETLFSFKRNQNWKTCKSSFKVTLYSYVSNKRRATFILFEEIFQALRSYSRPYVYLFLKKIIENFGENRKKWLFSAISLFNLTKIPGPPLVPDPTFIRFLYFFHRPYVYLQPYVY